MVFLGCFSKTVDLPVVGETPVGVYDSRIRNCDVGDNVLFSGVRNLANYVLKKDILLFDLETLAAIGESSFGNGTRLSVLNEVGGRTLTIFDRLSARVAYLSMILNAVT